jgi:hypothetical protein
MSEPADLDIFELGAAAKHERREALYRALTGPEASEEDADRELIELADRVAERLGRRIDELLAEPEPGVSTRERDARRERTARLIGALRGRSRSVS